MSTNYYLRTAEQSAADEDGMHLGLSAAGIFMFRAWPELGIISVVTLEKFLRASNDQIVSDYKETPSVDEFLKFVSGGRKPESRQFSNRETVTDRRGIQEGMRFLDAEGYLFHNYEFS
jgi:hypothetical protein